MQLLLHIPDHLGERLKLTIPSRQRSKFIAELLEKALPAEGDPLYLAALEVERDTTLNAEMREWREELIADGLRGADETD
ncbi:MAG: hypothetical protein LBS31_04710 [Candidatus Adiutrix sp.]|nr:hypothetical protein [Candidatus Adiutrix sp.]